jgi:hypothetical protein
LVVDCAERVSNEISSNSALSTLQGFVQRRRILVSVNVRVRMPRPSDCELADAYAVEMEPFERRLVALRH